MQKPGLVRNYPAGSLWPFWPLDRMSTSGHQQRLKAVIHWKHCCLFTLFIYLKHPRFGIIHVAHDFVYWTWNMVEKKLKCISAGCKEIRWNVNLFKVGFVRSLFLYELFWNLKSDEIHLEASSLQSLARETACHHRT